VTQLREKPACALPSSDRVQPGRKKSGRRSEGGLREGQLLSGSEKKETVENALNGMDPEAHEEDFRKGRWKSSPWA